MADEVDIANDLMAKQVLEALGKIRDSNAAQKLGSKICAECGEKIPDARRKLGFQLCVVCAEEAERRSSLFAG
jgi:phage/conjugal plasmid C-4 type zinc finger TraR family protein